MSKYTTTIANIVDTINNYDRTISASERIERARGVIFNFNYQIDPDYKKILETRIIEHFYMREIAHETVDYFYLRLKNKMSIIVPKYANLYKALIAEVNPLYNYELKESYKRINDGEQKTTNKGTSNSNSKQQTIFFDTPDGVIDTLSEQLSTNITDVNVSSDGVVEDVNSSDVKNVEDYVRNIAGNTSASYGSIIGDLKNNLVSIDEEIIKELESLFFALY